MEDYKHRVQYYETDKMSITHHSNYIRWMEEARGYFLSNIGWPYDRMEKEGIVSPVTAVECKYRRSTTFPDEISIRVYVQSFNGIRLCVGYEMKNADEQVVCTGHTEHCFLDESGKIVRMSREYPEFCEAIAEYIEE